MPFYFFTQGNEGNEENYLLKIHSVQFNMDIESIKV
jgi:hypothetical protein